MNTDELINKISAEGARKPLLSPVKQTLFWLAGTLLYLTAFSVYNGLRADIAEKLPEPLYLLEITLLFLTAVSAALAAFCLSRPDTYQKPWIKYVPSALLILWAFTAFAGSISDISLTSLFHSMTLGQFDCPFHIFLFSAPPGLAMFLIVRQGAPIRYCWAGNMVTLSVTSFGYLCMRLIEQNDNPVHLIIWHALPIFLMCLVGTAAGRYALHWRIVPEE